METNKKTNAGRGVVFDKEEQLARLNKGKEMKHLGTELFREGKFQASLEEYYEMVDFLEEVRLGQDDLEKERGNLVEAGLLNCAACKMKLEDWYLAIQMCNKVLSKNKAATKAWYRRGECNRRTNHFPSAKVDFEKVIQLEPHNKAAKQKIIEIEKEFSAMRRRIEGAIKVKYGSVEGMGISNEEYENFVYKAPIFGADSTYTDGDVRVPKFHKEYSMKFGVDKHYPKLFDQFLRLEFTVNKTTDALHKEVSDIFSNNSGERFGPYLKIVQNNQWNIYGDIFPWISEDSFREHDLFQSMKNYKVCSWKFRTGQTHVSLACADFSQLLFGTFVGDSMKATQFYAVDSSPVCILRCKVLNQMIMSSASSRSILQVWFSTSWSMATLDDFLEAVKMLLATKEQEDTERVLLKHWLSTDVSLEDTYSQWLKNRLTMLHSYEACANLRSEEDRVDYMRYLLTGIIFVTSEDSLICGNRTMYAIPQRLALSKAKMENFFYTLCSSIFEEGDNWIVSLKVSTEKYMLGKVDKIKEKVDNGLLNLTFECAEVSPDNKKLLEAVRAMNPCTVDWSNLPDFFDKTDFLYMARFVSGTNTVHTMHLMNWFRRVFGVCINDYDIEKDQHEIIEVSRNYCEYIHRERLRESPVYRSLWSDDIVTTSCYGYTMSYLSKGYYKVFLKELFGNVEHNMKLRDFEQMAWPAPIIYGSFTFADNINLLN